MAKTEYLIKFIFEQKCIPWRVTEFFKNLKNEEQRLRLQMTIIGKFVLRDIPLEHIYTGGFNGDRQFDFEHTPVERWHPSYLLKDSPHVKFLQQFKDAMEIDPEVFKTTEYFRYGCKDIRIYGDFFDILNEDGVIERAKQFLRLYRAVRDNACGKDYVFIPGDSHPKDCFMKASRIPGSGNYLIRSGHHRFAIYYVLGRTTVKARILGKAKISYKEILLKWEIHNRAKVQN